MANIKYAKDIEVVKCPVCGALLQRRDLTEDPAYIYSDYYCMDCEINLTIYTYLNEEDN